MINTRAFLSFVFVVLVGFFYALPASATYMGYYNSASLALQACQGAFPSPYIFYTTCHAINDGANSYYQAYGGNTAHTSTSFKEYYFAWGTAGTPNGCQAGSIVPAGTKYTQSSVTGEACTSGANSCEMSLVLGGPNSGSSMLTGNSCPASSDVPKDIPPVSETTNADGGKTYCDPISGTCVTVSPGPSDAPASSSSSANNSTDTTSVTNNPASSSSSTTTSTSTTTTTGTGSGTGSGDSTGVTQGTSHTVTDAPASSSSTASKCTTGACDVGNADGNIGQMYSAGTDTPASVYAQFKADVASSPLVGAATGFFNVSNIASGACPTWHIPGNKYWGESGFSFDFFCSSGMLAILALAGWMVLAGGAYCAFRIAIY